MPFAVSLDLDPLERRRPGAADRLPSNGPIPKARRRHAEPGSPRTSLLAVYDRLDADGDDPDAAALRRACNPPGRRPAVEPRPVPGTARAVLFAAPVVSAELLDLHGRFTILRLRPSRHTAGPTTCRATGCPTSRSGRACGRPRCRRRSTTPSPPGGRERRCCTGSRWSGSIRSSCCGRRRWRRRIP